MYLSVCVTNEVTIVPWTIIHVSFMQQQEWETLKEHLVQLIEATSSYAAYLAMRCKVMKLIHSSPEPVVNFSDAINLQYLPPSTSVSTLMSVLDIALSNSNTSQKIHVNEFASKYRRQRYLYIKELEKGLSCPMFLLTYSHGSNVGNYQFVWKAPAHMEACTPENVRLIEEIKSEIPTFHTRAVKQEF